RRAGAYLPDVRPRLHGTGVPALPRQSHSAAGPCLMQKLHSRLQQNFSMRSFIRTLDRLFIALALLLSAAILPSAAAQTPSAALASLAVELWPDYDRPAVLVLLTGALPASAPLPATVTIPVP